MARPLRAVAFQPSVQPMCQSSGKRAARFACAVPVPRRAGRLTLARGVLRCQHICLKSRHVFAPRAAKQTGLAEAHEFCVKTVEHWTDCLRGRPDGD